MAKYKNQRNTLLGYEDEHITDKHLSDVGFWTNKIGGQPDYPSELGKLPSPRCQLCNLLQPLILQIYAPLENNPFHRTLYIFGCMNPNCWNLSESWTCLRCQSYDASYDTNVTKPTSTKSSVEWCTGGDNWDDDNGNFESGSMITSAADVSDNDSDDSSSLSNGVGTSLVDECNANWCGAASNSDKDPGAVGKQLSPTATAEIEGDESEVVSIDTPTVPQKDLIALLQETAPVPYRQLSGENNQETAISFVPMFISVAEEGPFNSNTDHIRELIQNYQMQYGDIHVENDAEEYEHPTEKYERCVPPHGDKMYHQFVTRIQQNPGHVLRYGRELSGPLLLYPITDAPKKCRYCNGELIFELQILPTLIPKLHLRGERESHIDFGTVLIYTCKRSCWKTSDKFKVEMVIVQMEKF